MTEAHEQAGTAGRPYPVMLNLAGRLAVVVGGGGVGRRKVEALLACGAAVRVVEPAGGDWPADVQTVAEPYRPAHLDGAALAFACTDDRATNARVAADAGSRGLWVNVADDASAGDFSTPAVHQGEGVVLAVSTLGRAPGVSATLLEALVASLPANADAFAQAVGELRERIKAEQADPARRAEALRRISGPEALRAFHRGGPEALRALLDGGHEDVVGMDGG